MKHALELLIVLTLLVPASVQTPLVALAQEEQPVAGQDTPSETVTPVLPVEGTPAEPLFDTRDGPKTAIQLQEELAAAGYAGPWDIDSMLAAYQRAVGPDASTTDLAPAATAACGQNADRVLLSWQYDPYNPDRAISNATRELGLPAFGPAADFYSRSALRELYRAVATPGGMDPMNIRSRMLAGLKGATSQSSASQRVQYLVEQERKISAVNGQLRALRNDEQVRQIVDPTCPIFDSDIALVVYLVSVIESDANAAARLYSAQIYGDSSTSVWLTTADFLGRSLTRRQATGDQLRDDLGSLEFLSKMVVP